MLIDDANEKLDHFNEYFFQALERHAFTRKKKRKLDSDIARLRIKTYAKKIKPIKLLMQQARLLIARIIAIK